MSRFRRRVAAWGKILGGLALAATVTGEAFGLPEGGAAVKQGNRVPPSATERAAAPPLQKPQGNRTVAEAVKHYAPHVEPVLKRYFSRVGATYPPENIAFLAFKEERRLEVWARENNRWLPIVSYPVKAASGRTGPKLRQGDFQVPEGLYKLLWLNPNSQYHLSMKVDYPNAFDRQQAAKDKRANLGGDIFIHGKAASVGCLAMGDAAIEELFVLVDRVGVKNVDVIIAPRDLRHRPPPRADFPAWTPELYAALSEWLKAFKR